MSPRLRAVSGVRDSLSLVRRAGTPVLLLVLVLTIGSALLLAAELVLVRRIVDGVTSQTGVTTAVVLFGVATSGRRVIQSLTRELQVVGHERVSMSVMADVVDRSAHVPYERLEDADFRDTLGRALNAPDRVWATAYGLISALTGVVSTLAIGIVLLAIMPELVPVLGIAGLVLLATSVIRGRLVHQVDYRDTADDRERRYLESLLASRDAGRELRLFGSQRRLLDRHRGLATARLHRVESIAKRRLAVDLSGTVVLALVVVGVLVVVGRRASAGSLAIADAAAAAVAVQQLAASLTAIAAAVGALSATSNFVADISDLLASPASQPTVADTGSVEALVCDGVGYRYPGRDQSAVSDVSFQCRRGSVTALVGANGSGKSTLLKLLCGLYPVSAGSVELQSVGGGRQPTTGELAGLVTGVFQDFARYELPIRENLMLGTNREVSDDEIWSVLSWVGLADRLRLLPGGLDTRLGRIFADGVDVSVGEWQRLSLARAALGSAPFVVLDEPSSALDAAGEATLFANLRTAFAGRGVVVVSHRFATVRDADHIVVLDGGVVAEQGTHDELMAAAGMYASSYMTQAHRLLGKPVS